MIHFDVNVIDFVDFSITGSLHYNKEPILDQTKTSRCVFASSPKFAGLVVTESNPDHGHEDGLLASRFVRKIVDALCL